MKTDKRVGNAIAEGQEREGDGVRGPKLGGKGGLFISRTGHQHPA